MKLLDLYTAILSYCSMQPDEKGEIKLLLGDQVTPTKIEGKTMLMPTKENMKYFDPQTQIIFHPLKEYINRGESLVVQKLRHTLNIRINFVTLMLMHRLIEIIQSPELHGKFTPQQRELLRAVGDIPANTASKFLGEMVVKRLKAEPSSAVVNLYLKKSGTHAGKRHPRVGVSTFTIYEFLQHNRPEGLTKDATLAILKLVEYIFPESKDQPEAYNSFSDSQDIPWLECLLNTGYELTSRLEEIIKIFKPFIEDKSYYYFDHTWMDVIGDLQQFQKEIRMIPDQLGNEGAIEHQKATEAVNPESVMKSIFQETAQKTYQNQPQLPQSYQQPIQPQMQQAVMQQPVMQQPQAQSPYTSEGKLDFSKVLTPETVIASSMATPLTQADNMNQMAAMLQRMNGNPAAAYAMMQNNGFGTMIPGMMPMISPEQQQMQAYANMMQQQQLQQQQQALQNHMNNPAALMMMLQQRQQAMPMQMMNPMMMNQNYGGL